MELHPLNVVSMKRIPVKSTCLASVGYDPKRHILEVEFKGSRAGNYQYHGVPPQEHRRLMQADSVGKYYNRKIKDRYPFDIVREA